MAEEAKIVITSSADTKAVENADAKVKQLGKTARESGGAIDSMTRPASDAAGALGAIGAAVSVADPKVGALTMTAAHLATGIKGLGAAMKALLVNPLVLAITAIVGAFVLWKSHVEKTREALESLYGELTKRINNKIAKENRDIASSYAEMAHKIDDAADRLQHLHEIEDMRRDNDRNLADARTEQRKQLDIAGAGGDREAIAAIEREYQREANETRLSRAREDARTQADRAYGAKARDDFALRRQRIDDELAVRKRKKDGTLALAEGNLGNALTMSENQTLTEKDRKRYADSIPQLDAAVAAEKEKIAALERQRADLDREEEQAKEKSVEILESLNAAEAQAAAERIRLDNEETRQREELQQRMADLAKDGGLGGEWTTSTVAGQKANDRIASMGGFATAGAKAAAGASVTVDVQKQIKEQAVKQYEMLKKQLEKLDSIERKTGAGGATFA